MIKIGEFTYLQTNTLLVPKGSEVQIDLEIDDAEAPLHIIVKFEEDQADEKENRKAGLTVEGTESNACVTFYNWNKPFGSSIQKPIPFAESEEGDKVYLMASARLSGEIYELNLQFLKKEASE